MSLQLGCHRCSFCFAAFAFANELATEPATLTETQSQTEDIKIDAPMAEKGVLEILQGCIAARAPNQIPVLRSSPLSEQHNELQGIHYFHGDDLMSSYLKTLLASLWRWA